MNKILTTAAAVLVATAGMVSAASLSISGGSSASMPGGTATNDVLEALAGFAGSEFTDPMNVTEGGVITLSDTSLLRVEHVGFEAGYLNTFAMGTSSFSTTGGTALPTSLTSSYNTFYETQNAGVLRFAFLTPDASTSDGLAVGAPKNVVNSTGQTNVSGYVNFFSYQTSDGSIWLFLDDTGAGVDDNHDDMVVRISAVPLPAGAVLMLTGVAGFGAMRRRKKVA